MKIKVKYNPIVCPECKQKCTALVELNSNAVRILKALSIYVEVNKVNMIEIYNDVVGLYLTEKQAKNLSCLKYHEMITNVPNKRGIYKITAKGLMFLDGAIIPRYAVISKSSKRLIGYYNQDIVTTRINDFDASTGVWHGLNYVVISDKVIEKTQSKLL